MVKIPVRMPDVSRQAARPMVAVTLAFALGIALARSVAAYSFSGLAAGALLLLAAGGLALRRGRATGQRLGTAWAAGLTAVALCGLLCAVAHRDSFPDDDVRALLAEGSFTLDEPLAFDGCVLEESELRDTGSVTTVEFHGIQAGGRWRSARGKGILSVGLPSESPDGEDAGAGDAATPAAPAVLARGDRVRGWAVWRRPRNYENPGAEDRVARLGRRGVFVTGRAKSMQLLETIPGDCASAADRFAGAVRGRVRSGLALIPEAASGTDGDGGQGKRDGQEAAILASLVIGDYTGLGTATREAFLNTGTFHVLVVSGMHVAWIAGLLLLALKRLFVPERVRYLLAALAVFAYACVVGFQASITRCLWVFLLLLVGRLFFRRADALNTLFAAALVLLAWNPGWLYETGFQLSFLSVAALVLTASPVVEGVLRPLTEPLRHCGDPARVFTRAGRAHRLGRRIRTRCELFAEGLADRLLPRALPALHWLLRKAGGAAFAVASMVAASVAVQLWIEPLLAHGFNRLSWIGPLANIGIVPLSSAALAAGIAGVAAAWAGTGLVVALAGRLAALLLASAEAVARVPGAWQRCPSPSLAWVLAGIALFFVWGVFRLRRRWIPCLYTGLLLGCVALGTVPLPGFPRGADSPWPEGAQVLGITFLDVGQGDAAVIRFPNGTVGTLDAGGLHSFSSGQLGADGAERAEGFDVGEAVVSRYLWHGWTTRLGRVAISHTDSDHAGGVPALLKNFRVGNFDYAPVGAHPATLENLRALARSRGVRERALLAGAEERLGPVRVRTLHPAADSELAGPNANSLVLRLDYGRFSALLAGDLEKTGEAALLRALEDAESPDAKNPEGAPALLLKVAHHGSRTATSDYFLEKTRPRWAVVSVGRNNPYRHPSPDTLARLRNHAVRTFSTMDCGAVTCETDGERYIIRSHVLGVMEEGRL